MELRIGHLPWRYATGRIEIPGLRLVEGVPWELITGEKKWGLKHVRPEEGPRDPTKFAEFARQQTAKGILPIVLAPYLREDVRRALEFAGVSYFDFFGNVHIQAPPSVLVHIQISVKPELSRQLGLAGVRTSQVMLGKPTQAWAVTELAHEAQVSAGQAQNVMKTLEAEDLVITEGRGPARRRRIREPARFLDWLALQRPGREPRTTVSCAIYSRAAQDLWKILAAKLGERDYAITGAAAASMLGAGPTALPRTLVRIPAGTPLKRVALEIGAEPTERGANVTMWSDDGRLGVTGARQVAGARVASPVRVYLDLHAEPRGEDLASDFRERVLGF